MIDPHAHLRDWNEANKETISHALKLYSHSFFTDVFDMPNTSPPLTSETIVLKRLKDAERAEGESGVNYHLYGGITNDREQVKEIVSIHNKLFPKVIGLKMFLSNSTGNMGITDRESKKMVVKTLSDTGFCGVLAVHAESEELFKEEKYIKGRIDTWNEARPAEAEEKSIAEIIGMLSDVNFKGTLHICHITSKKGLLKALEGKKSIKITIGVTPHHALLNTESGKEEKSYLKVNPPIRDEENRAFIFSALLSGKIDNVESDHAPHTIKDKENGASGIPGIGGMLVLLDALRKKGLREERIEDLFGKNVSSQYGVAYINRGMPKEPLSIYKRIRGEYPFDPYSFISER